MKKRLMAWVLTVLLLLSACPLTAFAAGAAQVSVGDSTATQGGYAYLDLRATDFANVSALDIEIFYDSTVMSVNYVSNGSFFSGASVSTNTAAVGVIKISAMSASGFNGSGTMASLSFRVAADCPAGDYPLRVAVGDAYDGDLNPASIKSVSGTVTVKESATQSFSLSTSRSASTVKQGDAFSVQVNHYSGYWFAGADFRIEYDRDLLKLTAIELSDGLKVEGAVYSINGDNPGYAVISYASTNAVSASHLFKISFEAIANTNAQATIKIAADDVYDNDLIAYAPYTTSTSIQITEREVLPDYSDLTVATENFVLGETGAASVTLQGGADVAAADFTIHYDTTIFEVSAVTADPETVAAGALIVVNQNFGNGQIKFSYINQKGVFPDDVGLVHITLTAVSAPSKHFVLSATGADVYNIGFETTQLEYVAATACVFAPTVTPPNCIEEGYTTYACPDCGDSYVVDITDALGHKYESVVTDPTCTEDGYTTYTCSACGDTYVADWTDALGHDEVEHKAQAVTCTEIGWYDYVTCTRCEYTTYDEIAALGHDEVEHAAQEPTCTEIGWYDYVTCARCEYTTYVERAALGHRVLVDGRVWVDSIAFENDPTYPFLLQEGVYSSTNKWDNTDSYFRITALYDCSLYISYAVSSEANFDKVIIDRNGTVLVDISGDVGWSSQCIDLIAGDVVTINYHKDVSAANYEDTGWFSFTCEQTAIGALVPGPADEAEPTCTEAVICHFCPTLIKEALGHDEVEHKAQAVTCTEIGWYDYVTCTRCEYTTYDEIAALGHDEVEHAAQEPTCTEIGWYDYVTCTRCEYTTYVERAALGHDTVHHDAQEPTCTAIGWYAYEDCARCDYTTYIERSALGHDEVEHEAQESTCTEIGWYDYVTCTRCEYTTYDEIAALGHDEIAHAEQEVTCLEIGWNDYVTCSRCDYTTYVEIAALGHDTVYHEGKEPTCLEIGWEAHENCSRCDYTTYVEIPVLEHVYDGERDRDCNLCGAVREIPVLPGDVNGDDKVNNRDLGVFQRYLNDWGVTVDTKAGDMNSDGRINNRDLALLQLAINA